MQLKQTHIAFGFITALLMILASAGIAAMHMSTNKALGWAIYLLPLIGLILNGQAFAKANNHNVTFGNIFMSGFKASLIITLLLTIWTYVSFQIFPEIITQNMDKLGDEFQKQNISGDVADKTMAFMQRFFVPVALAAVFFTTLVTTILISLVAAAIPQKNLQVVQPAKMM